MIVSRRVFLRRSLAAAATGLLINPFTHRFAVADTVGNGSGKNLLVINLLGGVDGLAMVPFISGSYVSLFKQTLRPTLNAPTSTPLNPFPSQLQTQVVGLHPDFGRLMQQVGQRCAIIQGYGIPGDPGRSHDTCQTLMSLGVSKSNAGEKAGFLARLMDLKGWESDQYWAFLNENPSDTNTMNRQPIVLSDLASFDYVTTGGESSLDLDFAVDTAKKLLLARNSTRPLDVESKNALLLMHDSVQVVKSQILGQTVGGNVAGNYPDTTFGRTIRDIAKVLVAKSKSSATQQTKDTLILAGKSGFDTHSDQANTFKKEDSLAGLLNDLGSSLAVLVADLKAAGTWDKTTVVIYSEFGRTVRENGIKGDITVGTDHGHASNTIVIGGAVKGGVYGEPPSQSELLDGDYNALLPKIDYRDVFSDTLRWIGVDPKAVFLEDGYQPKTIGIL